MRERPRSRLRVGLFSRGARRPWSEVLGSCTPEGKTALWRGRERKEEPGRVLREGPERQTSKPPSRSLLSDGVARHDRRHEVLGPRRFLRSLTSPTAPLRETPPLRTPSGRGTGRGGGPGGARRVGGRNAERAPGPCTPEVKTALGKKFRTLNERLAKAEPSSGKAHARRTRRPPSRSRPRASRSLPSTSPPPGAPRDGGERSSENGENGRNQKLRGLSGDRGETREPPRAPLPSDGVARHNRHPGVLGPRQFLRSLMSPTVPLWKPPRVRVLRPRGEPEEVHSGRDAGSGESAWFSRPDGENLTLKKFRT